MRVEDQSNQYEVRLREMAGNFKIRTASRQPGATDEQVAGAFIKCLESIERGEVKPVRAFDESMPRMTVKEFLNAKSDV